MTEQMNRIRRVLRPYVAACGKLVDQNFVLEKA